MIWNPDQRGQASGRFSVACYCLVLSFSLAPAGAQQYTISIIAGGGAPVATPSRGVDLWIGAVSSLATDAAGNVYFPTGYSVFKLDPIGILTRIATFASG